jgi:hypothetical protein
MKNTYSLSRSYISKWKLKYPEKLRILRKMLEDAWKQGYEAGELKEATKHAKNISKKRVRGRTN